MLFNSKLNSPQLVFMNAAPCLQSKTLDCVRVSVVSAVLNRYGWKLGEAYNVVSDLGLMGDVIPPDARLRPVKGAKDGLAVYINHVIRMKMEYQSIHALAESDLDAARLFCYANRVDSALLSKWDSYMSRLRLPVKLESVITSLTAPVKLPNGTLIVYVDDWKSALDGPDLKMSWAMDPFNNDIFMDNLYYDKLAGVWSKECTTRMFSDADLFSFSMLHELSRFKESMQDIEDSCGYDDLLFKLIKNKSGQYQYMSYILDSGVRQFELGDIQMGRVYLPSPLPVGQDNSDLHSMVEDWWRQCFEDRAAATSANSPKNV